MVIEKSTQMGATTFGISKSFFCCDTLALSVIYYFPTDADIIELSQGRIKPIIMASPHLRRIIPRGHVDSVHLKKIGRGFLYIRGLKSRMRREAVPADLLIFDELDYIPEFEREHAEHRLDHSKYKWIIEISKPSVPNFGIDKAFRESDQRYWVIKCADGHDNIIEESFPDIVQKRKNHYGKDEYFLACTKCDKKLYPELGQWVAKCPDKADRKIGYHLCQLFSPRINLRKVMQKWEEKKSISLFFNTFLGLPYLEPHFHLEKDQVFACCLDYPNRLTLTVDERAKRRCVAGIDHDKQCFIVIKDIDTNEILCINRVEKFDDIDKYIERFNIKIAVCDNMPNIMEARKLKMRFPGKVFLCSYVDDPLPNGVSWDKKEHTVSANRTDTMDSSQVEIESMTIKLPKKSKEIGEFAGHCVNLLKQEVTSREGTVKWTYTKIGPDHYRHAFNYACIAASYFTTGDVKSDIYVI